MSKLNIFCPYKQTNATEYIEIFLQKYLKYYFWIVFITTTTGVLYNYCDHHAYKMGDWLINYQGGIIRRGFTGELSHQLYILTGINPGVYIAFIEFMAYAIFLFFSFKILKSQQLLLPYSFLILSPFLFTFQINDLLGGYRKEILYIATIAFTTYIASTKEDYKFEKIFYILLLIYPFIVLSHEMLVLFLPYLLAIYVIKLKPNIKQIVTVVSLSIPSIIAFTISLQHSGTTAQIEQIIASLASMDYTVDKGGAISFLNKSSQYGIQMTIASLKENYYFLYIIPLLIALLAYVPLINKIRLLFNNKLALLLILSSIVGTIPLFAVAVDWGRFIYIHLVSIAFLSLLPITNNTNECYWFCSKITKKQIILFFIIYSMLWHIPHAGNVFRKTFRQQNIIAFFIPYANLARCILQKP